MQNMEQLLCLTQFMVSVLFVHRIKLEIKHRIQVHVMAESLFITTFIQVLRAAWDALQYPICLLMSGVSETELAKDCCPSRLAARTQAGHAKSSQKALGRDSVVQTEGCGTILNKCILTFVLFLDNSPTPQSSSGLIPYVNSISFVY